MGVCIYMCVYIYDFPGGSDGKASVYNAGDLYIYIYIYTHMIFHILFHYRLLKDIEYSSLSYTGLCCLSILYIVVCIC